MPGQGRVRTSSVLGFPATNPGTSVLCCATLGRSGFTEGSAWRLSPRKLLPKTGKDGQDYRVGPPAHGPAPATPGLTHLTCPPTRAQRNPSLVHEAERPPSLPPFPGGQRVKECSKSTSHQRAMPGTVPPTEVLGKCWALGRAHATAGQDSGAGGPNHLPRASRDHRPGACGGDREGPQPAQVPHRGTQQIERSRWTRRVT